MDKYDNYSNYCFKIIGRFRSWLKSQFFSVKFSRFCSCLENSTTHYSACGQRIYIPFFGGHGSNVRLFLNVSDIALVSFVATRWRKKHQKLKKTKKNHPKTLSDSRQWSPKVHFLTLGTLSLDQKWHYSVHTSQKDGHFIWLNARENGFWIRAFATRLWPIHQTLIDLIYIFINFTYLWRLSP